MNYLKLAALFILGFVAGEFSMRKKQEIVDRKNTILHEKDADASFMKGFDSGWESALDEPYAVEAAHEKFMNRFPRQV